MVFSALVGIDLRTRVGSYRMVRRPCVVHLERCKYKVIEYYLKSCTIEFFDDHSENPIVGFGCVLGGAKLPIWARACADDELGGRPVVLPVVEKRPNKRSYVWPAVE